MENEYTPIWRRLSAATSSASRKLSAVPAQSPNANTILIILIGLSKFNMASRCALCQTPSAADADLDARYRSFYAPMRKGLESLSPYKHEWRDV
mgnify:FL=1